MERKNAMRPTYMPPVARETEILPMTVLASSLDPTDWNDGSIPDAGFVDIFTSFDTVL